MIYPFVTVVVITYNRVDTITRTVTALRDHLNYPPDKLRWLIADDSSPDNYIGKLKRKAVFKELNPVYLSTPQNGGWGKNANHALKQIDADCEYVFFLEDDYVLGKPLNLLLGVALMESKPDIGMLRYRGTAGDHAIFHQFEADISRFLPDYRDGFGLPGKLTYLQLDSGSQTAYIYSNGPHLKRRTFHQFYGWYPEGRKLAITEESYAIQTKTKMREAGAPAIAILPDWVKMEWDHVGVSFQGSPDDKGV